MKLCDLLTSVSYQMTNGEIDLATEITDICFDSRKVHPGAMFVCLKGEQSDGHDYAQVAAQNGAVVIVAEHATKAPVAHCIVSDSRRALFEICANFYGHPERELQFIGVTGTNGKTSTTFFIKQLLDALGEKTGLIGTVCNMIGNEQLASGFTTPEPTVLFDYLSQMREKNVKYVIMEVSSHSLAQNRVCGISFDVGVFTNLTQDHLDYHKTIENYKNEKKKLFEQSKVCVFNLDDATGAQFFQSIEGKPCFTYSAKRNEADFVARDINLRSDGVDFIMVTRGALHRASVSTPGMFTVYNVAAALSAICALGFSFDLVASKLGELPRVDGRAQLVSDTGDFSVMIDYAHTPDALENILKTIQSYGTGRIITLFGCGGDRDRTKRPIMGEIAAQYSDYLIVTSDNPRTEDPDKIIADIMVGVSRFDTPHTVIVNRREAIAYALQMAQKDDIILLAGKGHEKYQILPQGKIDFDEEKIVKDCLMALHKTECL